MNDEHFKHLFDKIMEGRIDDLLSPANRISNDIDYWNQLRCGYNYGEAFSPETFNFRNNPIMDKTNFPIGAEVYVRDNSYAKNMNTGRNDLWIAGTQGKRGPKCKVMSTPFTAIIVDRIGDKIERQMILVEPAGAMETYMVLNRLEDANVTEFNLLPSSEYRTEIHWAKEEVTVGCQRIPFAKVKELAAFISGRAQKPETFEPKSGINF